MTALAVVATAGAAATPLLIRIIRPVIKKLWTTIQKKLGKNVRQLSKSEIETNKYREKRTATYKEKVILFKITYRYIF